MGASPIVMAWGEVYLGLKTGTVNAVTAPANALWANKFTEVAKYVTFLDQIVQTINLQMNKALFDSLSEEYQNILIDSANDAGAYYTSLVNGNWEEEKNRMIKEHGAEFLTVDLTPWVKKAQPMIYEFEEEGLLPKGLYDRFQAIPD
jgi:TRAP-type C4-dicarboxylate transport system substrate-binding protein